jgi:hypothetical protein
MNKNLKGIQLSGIVKPGEIYILTKAGWALGDVESLYTIKADDEIIPALDLEGNIVCKEFWTFHTLLGIERISADAHLIRVLCYDRDKDKEITVSYELHRIKSFLEELARMKVQFKCK